MRQEKILAEPQFDPRLKRYLMIQASFVIAATFFGIPFLIVWWLIGPAWAERYFASLSVKLGERSLMVEKGVWFRSEKTIPLEKITDLSLVEGPILRWLGLASLSIETAGQMAQAGATARLVAVINPREFRDAVLDQRDRVLGVKEPSESVPEAVAPVPPVASAVAEPPRDSEQLARIEGVLGEIRDLLARDTEADRSEMTPDDEADDPLDDE